MVFKIPYSSVASSFLSLYQPDEDYSVAVSFSPMIRRRAHSVTPAPTINGEGCSKPLNRPLIFTLKGTERGVV